MLQGTYLILVEFMPGKYRKAALFILSAVYGWTHFSMQYAAYMSSSRCEVSCWQPHSCNVNGQTSKLWGRCSEYSESTSFWQCSCADYNVRFSFGFLRTKFQATIFLFLSLWQHGRGKWNVPRATKNLYEEISHKIFSGISGKISFASPTIACSYTYVLNGELPNVLSRQYRPGFGLILWLTMGD